mmetsp:Transcript_10225/g.19623  ORF Transcript_10225/g.19623 Transcript_10225/m.19623 type:complete len:82 (-) Transcript_10225:363-608(-)
MLELRRAERIGRRPGMDSENKMGVGGGECQLVLSQQMGGKTDGAPHAREGGGPEGTWRDMVRRGVQKMSAGFLPRRWKESG